MARAYRISENERARQRPDDYRVQRWHGDSEWNRFGRAKDPSQSKGWMTKEDEWARMSLNRDLGMPIDYDEASKSFTEAVQPGERPTSETIRSAAGPQYQRQGQGEHRPETARERVRQGMDVFDVNGRFIGRVRDLRQDDFSIDRRLAWDVRVSLDKVTQVNDRVVIDVDSRDFDKASYTMW